MKNGKECNFNQSRGCKSRATFYVSSLFLYYDTNLYQQLARTIMSKFSPIQVWKNSCLQTDEQTDEHMLGITERHHTSTRNSYTFVVLFIDPTKKTFEFSLNFIHLGEAILKIFNNLALGVKT